MFPCHRLGSTNKLDCPHAMGLTRFHHHAIGCEGRVEIESEWTARKRERAAGRLCPAVELPHSSQNRAGVGHRCEPISQVVTFSNSGKQEIQSALRVEP